MSHVLVCALLAAIASNIVVALGTNQHLICKTVDDVFAGVDSTADRTHTARRLHGPPGKRGQQGVKGEAGNPGLKGEKGLPGSVDSQEIENVVQEKVREATRELLGRIEVLERFVDDINSTDGGDEKTHLPYPGSQTVSQRNSLVCKEGEFTYRTKCYFTIIHDRGDTPHQAAKRLCIASGGTAADVLNREHLDLIVSHIRSKTSSQREIWLGMSYAPSTSSLRWSNGDRVPRDVATSMTWWRGYPSSSSNRVMIELAVSSNAFGLVNLSSSYPAHGVLCEK